MWTMKAGLKYRQAFIIVMNAVQWSEWQCHCTQFEFSDVPVQGRLSNVFPVLPSKPADFEPRENYSSAREAQERPDKKHHWYIARLLHARIHTKKLDAL